LLFVLFACTGSGKIFSITEMPANMTGPSQETVIEVMITLGLQESSPLLHLGRRHRANYETFRTRALHLIKQLGISQKPPHNGFSFFEGNPPSVALRWPFLTRKAVRSFFLFIMTTIQGGLIELQAQGHISYCNKLMDRWNDMANEKRELGVYAYIL
jgi:hypothetical protein